MRIARIVAAAFLIAFLVPGSVAAHAALDVPTPADGTTVQGTPTEVAGTFTQDLETDGSSLQLRNAAGDVLAMGAVDPADARRMIITALPELEPGDYEVRWVTLSAEDGELERDTWTFTVVAAAGTTMAPTTTPSPTLTSPTPTVAPTIEPSEDASSFTDFDNSNPSGTDVLLPIVAGLAIVLVAAGALLRRRGQSGQSGQFGPSGRSGPSA